MVRHVTLAMVLLCANPDAAVADDSPDSLERAAGYLEAGFPVRAITLLESLDTASTDQPEKQLLNARAHLQVGLAGDAAQMLEAILAKSGADRALVLNDLGVVRASLGDDETAARLFRESLNADPSTNVEIDARINLARLNGRMTGDDFAVIEGLIGDLHNKATGDRRRLSLAALGVDSGIAADVVYALAHPAVASPEPAIRADAHEVLARLYAREQRLEEALQLARQASFISQSASLTRQQWRHDLLVARLLADVGQTSAATEAYRQALASLAAIKQDIPETPTVSYRRLVSPIFYEYAGLALTEAPHLPTQQQRNARLRDVRDTLEQVRAAEIQEYYQDQCVVAERQDSRSTEVSDTTAVLYPILMPDRTEVIISIGENMYQYTSALAGDDLVETIDDYRRELESYGAADDYLYLSRLLYDALIRPAEEFLATAVDTIVFVPDGAWRTIPISTLYDGEQFLVESYAIAVTPGMSLTSSGEAQEEAQVLVGGITESVMGFDALPNVEEEIEMIDSMYPARIYKDREFVIQRTADELSTGNYNVVHIATHGEFDADHSKSFLLAYDSILSMDQFQQIVTNRKYNDTPLELLVLSACKTAAGDEKAALGLAGVALRSGAKSALATLWYISDEATARIVGDFYHELRESGTSKAMALRNAQLPMIRDPYMNHPTDWAPFILVGNWL